MSFEYVNKTYGLSVKRGDRVSLPGSLFGRITSATHYLNVRIDGRKFSVPYHPTDVKVI